MSSPEHSPNNTDEERIRVQVDEEVYHVYPTDNPRKVIVQNVTRAEEIAEMTEMDIQESIDTYTYETLVCPHRELVFGTDDPETINRLDEVGTVDNNGSTEVPYDVSVARAFGFEVLSYDITGDEIRTLKFVKDIVGDFDWDTVSQFFNFLQAKSPSSRSERNSVE